MKLRLNSLYKFYQGYFNYTSDRSKTQKMVYAFAIRDTATVLRKVYAYQNYSPLYQYFNRDKKSQIAVKFLKNIKLLAEKRYKNPLEHYKFFDSTIKIDGSYLSTNKKEIIIPCPYICDENNKEEIIILTFGSPINTNNEIAVLKGLITEFNMDKPFPVDMSFVTYWNLSIPDETTVDYRNIRTASRASLIETLNKF